MQNKNVDQTDDFQSMMNDQRVGDTIKLSIRRDKELLLFHVTLGRRPSNSVSELQNHMGSELSSRRDGLQFDLAARRGAQAERLRRPPGRPGWPRGRHERQPGRPHRNLGHSQRSDSTAARRSDVGPIGAAQYLAGSPEVDRSDLLIEVIEVAYHNRAGGSTRQQGTLIGEFKVLITLRVMFAAGDYRSQPRPSTMLPSGNRLRRVITRSVMSTLNPGGCRTMLDFPCPGCGKNIQTKDEFAGKTARCPSCQTKFVVPGPSGSFAASPPAAPAPPPVSQPARDTQANFDEEPVRPSRFEEPEKTPSSMDAPRPTPSATSTTLKDFLAFRRMVVPLIIQVIFWLGVGLFVLAGLISMISGISRPGERILILLGFLWIIFGPIVWRIYCEVLIVIFRINETLTDIKNELKRRPH